MNNFATSKHVTTLHDEIMERFDRTDAQLANMASTLAEALQTVRFVLQNMPAHPVGSTTNNPVQAETSSPVKFTFPISTTDELQNFESLLDNEETKKQIMAELIRQHGTNVGVGLGAKQIAFDLNAKMFKPQLFTFCSWTGQAYDKDFPDGKFEFKRLNNTIMLFWEIVNNADKSYDLNSNKLFFQKRMFSSKRKLVAEEVPDKKQIRSSSKNRPKNLTYKRRAQLQSTPLSASSDKILDEPENLNNDSKQSTLLSAVPDKILDEPENLNNDSEQAADFDNQKKEDHE